MASGLLVASLLSCAPQSTPTVLPAPAPTPTAATARHGDRIRFALIGDVTATNVWSLFDSSGYTYNNYAVRAGYWPRLFTLSVPDEQFQTQTASGMPSPFRQEGDLFVATVPVRSDLSWSDGSRFGAEDVAFTVNTALIFQLGFDWHDYYNPQLLDHAEAVDANTVKFFFKQMPDVSAWQYGALQGPVVQRTFWSEKVSAAEALLPHADLLRSMTVLNATIANTQQRLDALYAEAVTAQGPAAREVQAGLRRETGNLDEAMNSLAKTQAQYDDAIQSARDALHAADASGEPLLGPWAPVRPTPDANEPTSTENKANPEYPGFSPNFDEAVYHRFPTRAAALAALEKGDVDVVLDPTQIAAETSLGEAMTSPDRNLRFVVFNLQEGPFQDAALRKAVACMLNQDTLEGQLAGRASALKSFVPAGEGAWHAADAQLPCEGLDDSARLKQAIKILQDAGYSWETAPSEQTAAEGLAPPGGPPMSALQLMSPASDELGAAAATYVQRQARLLGIPLTVQNATPEVIDYALFSSGDFDAALVGWRVGRFPAYLCGWFGAAKPFQYEPSRVTSLCRELEATSDLGAAQEKTHEIQSALADDVPMVPLYSGIVYDPYGNVVYPFSRVLGGLSGVYGAPGLAIPAPP